MTIKSGAAFAAFYEIFVSTLLDREFKGKVPNDADIYSKEFWFELKLDRFNKLFRSNDVNTADYFQRKYRYFLKYNEGPVDAEGMINALRYIGGLQPKSIPPIQVEEVAETLWKKFQIKYKSKIEKERRARKRRKKLEPVNPVFESVSNLIEKFYICIWNQEYETAWDLLSSDFQNRPGTWKGDINRFKDGYTNTVKISDIRVFEYKEDEQNPNVIECFVVYQDHMSSWTSKELSNLRDLKVKDIDLFCERVKIITGQVERNGIANFSEEVELYKLFECGVTDYIAFKCKYPLAKLPEVFNSKRPCKEWRAFSIECKFLNSAWKIHRITGIPFTNLR